MIHCKLNYGIIFTSFFCKKLPKMLTYVGDYDFQASIVEAVFRMTNSEFRRREVTKWFPKLDCRIHSLFIRIKDFDPDVRRFLNAYNKCLGPDQLVFSIPCDSVSMGQVALVKPKVATYEKFWIDFNLGTCSILIICHKDCGDEDAYESVWEPIMVKVQDVVSATLVQTVHSFTLEIVLPSVEACANLFFSQASQEFEKLLTDTVVLEFPPQKNLARICRTIFEDKLKNSAEELDCWMANGSKGSIPFSGEKVSSSSSRQKKRTSSAHGLKAYQNSSKESKTDSSTFKIKIASDEHGRIPAKKKRRKSRNVTHVLSCTDSSELVEERPNNSRGKGLKTQSVSPLLHRQKNYLSSHSKKRAIESVVKQDLKVMIPDSQDYEEIRGNVTEKSTEDEDVIPCSLDCQAQKKLSSFGCKTSVNIFPIMRKIESVTQVDLEVDVVEDESEIKDFEVDVVEDESELKVEEKSCKKMFQNYEDVSSHNADMVNVYQSNSEGNRKQLSTSKIEFDKKQTRKNTKCSLAKSPLNICSISKSLKEPVNISPDLESSEPPPQSSTYGIKVSEIIIEKNLKKNQEISVLRKVQEGKDSVPNEKPLDNRILVPSPNPDERLLCNKTTIPPSPSPVEELFDSGSTLPPVRAEECVNSANTAYSPLSISESQLEKTGIVPEIKHCNSVPIDNEMKHLLFKSCTSATSAPATSNIEQFSAAKPFLTRSISESVLKENGSQNLIEILPFHPKFDSFKTIRKESVVSLPQTCSHGSSMKWSKKKCNISISNTIEILNFAVNVETNASDSLEILNHSFSKTSAKHVEDSSALSHENLKSPRPTLLSTLKILAEYPIKSPVNYSSTRKEKKEIREKELPQVLDTQVSTPRAKKQKISHPLSEHSSGNTPSRTFENKDKVRNTPKKKKLFDTSSFEILQDSPPMEQDSPPREEIIHSDMYTTDERHRLAQEARKSSASRLQAERVELNEIHVNGSKRSGKQSQRKIIFKHKDTVDDTQKLSCKKKSLKENEACLESRDLFEKSKSSKKLKKDKSNISELSGGFLEYPEIKDISAKEHSVYSDYSSSSVETEHSWLIKKKSKLSNVSKTYPNKGKTLSKSETTRFSSNEDWEPFKERKRKRAQKDSDTSVVKSKQEPIRKSKRRSCKEGISYYEKSPLDSDVELQKNSIISPTKSRDWECENPVSPETLRHSESSVDSGNSNYLNFHLSQKITENKKVIPISAKGDRIGNEISKCFTSFSDNSSLDLSFIALDNSGHKTLNKKSSVRSKNKLVFGVTEAVIHASEEGTCSKDVVPVSETFGEEVVIISEMSGILESNQTNNHFDCDGPLQSTLIQNEDGHLPSTGRFSYVADVENNSLCQGNNIELAHCAEETGGDLRLPESVSSFENNVYLPFENLQTSNDISKVSECSFGMKERFSSNQKTIETSGEVNSVVCRVLAEDEEVVTEPCHDDNQGIGKGIYSSESNGRLPEDKGKEVATSVKYVSGHEMLFSEKIMLIVDREIAGTDLKSPTKNLSCNATGQGGTTSSVVVGTEEHLHGNQFVESSSENCAASAGKKSLVKHSFCQNANQSVIEKGISTMSPTISQVANCISPDTTNMNDAPPNTPVSQSSDTPLGEVLQLMDKLSNNGFQDFVQANGISPTSHVCDTPTLPAPRQLFSTGDGVKNAEKGTNKQPRSSCLQLIELLSQSSDKHDFLKFMEDLKWFSESLRKVVSSFNTAVSSLHTLSASVDDVISNFGTGRS
ncbi:uncharacterized protein LOC135207355 isoform X2 [Macrobrachium nipponense]|uniref:uncharacterized protein LOC135207355 isoform X2 n=1 Tax=Macrobrachium nipponense TaxID=159736 RepID=UPI0030C87048